jgi:hypothetical protein
MRLCISVGAKCSIKQDRIDLVEVLVFFSSFFSIVILTSVSGRSLRVVTLFTELFACFLLFFGVLAQYSRSAGSSQFDTLSRRGVARVGPVGKLVERFLVKKLRCERC